MRNNGVIVQSDNQINVTSAARFILNGIDGQAVEDIRLHLLNEAKTIMQKDLRKIQQHGLLFVSAAVTLTIGDRACEIFAASVLEDTKRLDIDAKLIIAHHAYLGTEDEIDALAQLVARQGTHD